MFLTRYRKKNKKYFLADPQLFVMGIVALILNNILVFVAIFLLLTENAIDSVVIFFVADVIFSVACICSLPKWRIVIELSETGISYKQTFKKKIEKRYSDFGYFYCATYTYYTQKKFIVFSERRLSDYELTHINNVPVSDKLIKIKVRKGLKDDLSQIMPAKYFCRIPKDFLN